eukprot:CAMPEP_0167755192 /NCGR_PEP_ID=MMETSP0110_2-20121227/8687_1 /TAXON_ID=629695 /ORGANISM="Gymnochlora sp., Strain CCMP2014" /LENGTH=265 /DNA_ID=CAMNT_0007641151 /DNA_START=134 /DNA_END=932 /DNA_ORIENTATION=-
MPRKRFDDCIDAFPRRVGRRRNHFFKQIVTEDQVKGHKDSDGLVVQQNSRRRKTTGRTRRRKKKRTLDEMSKSPVSTSKKLRPTVAPLQLSDAFSSKVLPLPSAASSALSVLPVKVRREASFPKMETNVFESKMFDMKNESTPPREEKLFRPNVNSLPLDILDYKLMENPLEMDLINGMTLPTTPDFDLVSGKRFTPSTPVEFKENNVEGTSSSFSVHEESDTSSQTSSPTLFSSDFSTDFLMDLPDFSVEPPSLDFSASELFAF